MHQAIGWLISAACVLSVRGTAESCASACDGDITCGWWMYSAASGGLCTLSDANKRPNPKFQKVNAVRTGCDAQYHCLICPSNETGASEFFGKQYINSILYVSTQCSHLSSTTFDTAILLENFTAPLYMRDSMSVVGGNTIRIGQDIRITGNNNTIREVTLSTENRIVLSGVSIDGLVIQNCRLFEYSDNALVVITESTVKRVAIALGYQKAINYATSFGVAIAHVDGDLSIVCAGSRPAMIVQQTVENNLLVTQSGCNETLDINITDLLAIYGSKYEVEFYHSGHYVQGNQYLRTTALRSFYAVLILIAVLMLCNPDVLFVYFFRHRYKKEM